MTGKPLSDLVDLIDWRSGPERRHQHGKVMSLIALSLNLLILWSNLLFGERSLTWPEITLMIGCLAASFGGDVFKAALKIRRNGPNGT